MEQVRHIIESQQFDRDFLARLYDQADHMSQVGRVKTQEGRVMASLFYEPSTRTRFSFEAAMYRVGGQVITTENAREFSSLAKGESLEDSIHVMSGYADVIVMRHNEIGAAKRASQIATVPIINGGDGAGQHPTQALLDMFTLYRRFKELDGLKVAMVGDLRYGRTVRSLAYLLAKYDNVELTFVAPEPCQMQQDIKEYLDRQNVKWRDEPDLDKVLGEVNCVYMTRVQRERFVDQSEYELAKDAYRLSTENVGQMSKDAIIMHPLPRVTEIDPELDSDPRAVYFEQAQNGLWVRMAIIDHVLGGWD